MKAMLLVGVGGFVGSIARYKLGAWLVQSLDQGRFPSSTFAINVVGCLLIGLMAGLAERYGVFGPSTRLVLFTGLLGGFTTFSTFGLETMLLLRRGDVWIALAYVAGSVLLGVAAVWLGVRSVGLLPGPGWTG